MAFLLIRMNRSYLLDLGGWAKASQEIDSIMVFEIWQITHFGQEVVCAGLGGVAIIKGG